MICIHHSRDLDGWTSGAIVRLKYPQCKLIGYDYGQPFPWDQITKDDFVRTKQRVVASVTMLTIALMVGFPMMIYKVLPMHTLAPVSNTEFPWWGLLFWTLTVAFWVYSILIYSSYMGEKIPNETNTNDNYIFS